MLVYENECCNCAVPGYPCLGESCSNKRVPHFYCDSCKNEHDTVYEFDGEELCIGCIEKRLDKVEG